MIKKILQKIKHHYFDKKYTIDFLAVVVGQKCTLKCKHCANFTPYQPKFLDSYDMVRTIEDIKNVTKRIKCIKKLHLQGGDFFLHKDAKKLLEYVVRNEKIKKCQIATNCILIPPNDTLDILQNSKFVLRISSYENVNETNKEKLIQILEENKIKYRIYSFANKNSSWSDLGGVDTPKHTKEETERNYKNCLFKRCLTLENGKIARCARATVAHYLQHFKLKKTDFVNVRKFTFSISELKKYVQKTAKTNNSACFRGGVMTACYYCNGTSGISIPAGEQLNIEELKEIRRKYNDR